MTDGRKMNPEVKAKWLAALRSGDYTQAKGGLYDGKSYCCLGVLCDLAVKEGVVEPPSRSAAINGDGSWFYFDEMNDLLPVSVMAWAGLDEQSPELEGGEPDEDGELAFREASEWNDSFHASFAEIADMIEDQL